MKKILSLIALTILVIGLGACSTSPSTVDIEMQDNIDQLEITQNEIMEYINDDLLIKISLLDQDIQELEGRIIYLEQQLALLEE